jgi:glutamine amidotransferase
MTTAIIDYGVGNLGAIPNMLDRLGEATEITSDPGVIESAQRIVLPGVGAFGAGMASLRDRDLLGVLHHQVRVRRIPTLGLCLGMQLLFEDSEVADVPGLGFLKGHVVRFRDTGAARELPVPHMGWRHLSVVRDAAILEGLGEEARFYFAHSYHVEPTDPSVVVATATYRYAFAAVIQEGNITGAQFHPEKSHRFGLQLLANFVSAG